MRELHYQFWAKRLTKLLLNLEKPWGGATTPKVPRCPPRVASRVVLPLPASFVGSRPSSLFSSFYLFLIFFSFVILKKKKKKKKRIILENAAYSM
jgi:hypothetical protein